jgi:hypothetical protein
MFVAGLACALATPAWAQTLSREEIQRSVWSTEYESLGGSDVQARLTLSGDTGSYAAGGSRGSLSNVDYKFSSNVEGNATVTGNWSMDGASGKFTFFISGPAFSGSWQAGGRSGGWNGRFVSLLQGGGGAVTYSKWTYHPDKDYYYCKCSFPAGGYQYVIYYKTKPNWVYWFNPDKNVFWCACPTVNHPRWGNAISNGQDLFLLADTKARHVEDCEFPDPGDDGANFTKGKAKDKDGSDVDLGCPPTDLP